MNRLLKFATRIAADVRTDRALLESFAASRDSDAMAELFRRYAPVVRRAAADVCPAAADEVVQSAFLLLADRAATLTDRASAAGWLFHVARRLALKARTAAARRARHEARVPPPAGPAPVLDDLAFREVRALVAEELDQLPERLRAPLVLHYWEGAGHAEAAARLGCSVSTLKRLLDIGRERLGVRLARRGLNGASVLVALAAIQSRATAGTPLEACPVRDTLAAGSACSAEVGRGAGGSGVAKGLVLAAGVLAAGAALALGLAVTRADKPLTDLTPGAAAGSIVFAPIPPPVEPEWAKRFNATYQLEPGTYVKRIPAPFIPERRDFVQARFPRADETSLIALATMGVLFAEADGKTVSHRAIVSTDAIGYARPTQQVRKKRMSLRSVIAYCTGRLEPEVVFDARAKDRNVITECDFVIRQGAPLEKLIPDLQKAIERCESDEPGPHPILTLKEEEQDVFVASGKFAVAARKWRGAGEVDVYADEGVVNKGFTESTPRSTTEVTTATDTVTPVQFVRELGAFVNRRMVWEAVAPGGVPFRTYTHSRRENTATVAERAADRDPEKVMKNVSEQTGLVFKKERRKVLVLYVEIPRQNP